MKIKNTVFELPPPSLHLETNDGTTVTADGYPVRRTWWLGTDLGDIRISKDPNVGLCVEDKEGFVNETHHLSYRYYTAWIRILHMYPYMISLNSMLDTVDFDELGRNRSVADYFKLLWNAIRICLKKTGTHKSEDLFFPDLFGGF